MVHSFKLISIKLSPYPSCYLGGGAFIFFGPHVWSNESFLRDQKSFIPSLVNCVSISQLYGDSEGMPRTPTFGRENFLQSFKIFPYPRSPVLKFFHTHENPGVRLLFHCRAYFHFKDLSFISVILDSAFCTFKSSNFLNLVDLVYNQFKEDSLRKKVRVH